MHSFQPSRGRIFFEVLLALGMAGSLAVAWMQTGAVALLGAAGVAALYGLIHLFDMRRSGPASAAEPQRIEFEVEIDREVALAPIEAVRPSAGDQQPAADTPASAPEAKAGGKGKAPRKAARRPKAGKAVKLVEPVAAEEPEAPWPLAVEEAAEVELALPADAEEFAFDNEVEPAHPHIAPLFEPEPFARMPRRAFGRRGRI